MSVLLVVEMPPERVKRLVPAPPVGGEPDVELVQWGGVERVDTPVGLAADLDEPGLAQHAQVLRGARLAQPQVLDELAHRSRPLEQQREHGAAIWVGEGLPGRRHGPNIPVRLYSCQGIYERPNAMIAAVPRSTCSRCSWSSARRASSVSWASSSRGSVGAIARSARHSDSLPPTPESRPSTSTRRLSGEKRRRLPFGFSRPAFSIVHPSVALMRFSGTSRRAMIRLSASRSSSISPAMRVSGGPNSGLPWLCFAARLASS